jgi:hypothetical protein
MTNSDDYNDDVADNHADLTTTIGNYDGEFWI